MRRLPICVCPLYTMEATQRAKERVRKKERERGEREENRSSSSDRNRSRRGDENTNITFTASSTPPFYVITSYGACIGVRLPLLLLLPLALLSVAVVA